VVIVSVFQKGKVRHQVSDVGIDHMRRHMISQAGDKGHVVRHVTLSGSE